MRRTRIGTLALLATAALAAAACSGVVVGAPSPGGEEGQGRRDATVAEPPA